MPPQDLRAALRRVLSDSVRQYPKGSHRSTGEGTLPSCSSPSRLRVANYRSRGNHLSCGDIGVSLPFSRRLRSYLPRPH